MSSYSTVKAASWRLVEVGRIVLLQDQKLATIVEIIDQKRVLIDGPHVQRQAIFLSKLTLTPLTISLTRGARTGTVEKRWASENVDKKWAATAWAKKLATRQRRSQLSDFERFQVMVLKKQRRFAVKKALAKA